MRGVIKMRKLIKYIQNYLFNKNLIYNNKAIFSVIELEKIYEFSNKFTKFDNINFFYAFNFSKLIIQKKLNWLNNFVLFDNKLIEFEYKNKKLYFTQTFVNLINQAITEFNIINANIKEDLSNVKFKDESIYIDENFTYENFLNICSEITDQDFTFDDFKEYNKIFSKNIKEYNYIDDLDKIVFNKIVKLKNVFPALIKPIDGNFAFDFQGSDAYGHSTQITRSEYEKIQTNFKYHDIIEDKTYSIPKKNFTPIETFKTQNLDLFIRSKTNENIQYILSESFVSLENSYYDVYGFFKKSDITGMPYFLIIDAIKTTVNEITSKNILEMQGNCNFDKYINFIYNYINKVGKKYNIKLNKKIGQAYVLNYALTHIVNALTGTRCHSILLGGQDKGKSYISAILSALYYPFVEIVEGDFSRAGLVAAANQTIATPTEVFKNQLLFGSFSKSCVILEEFFDIYNENNFDHQDILSTMKTGLIKKTVKLGKMGAIGEIPFNATVIITGNYKAAKIEEDINEAKKIVYMRKKELKQENKDLYGENKELNLLFNSLSLKANADIEELFNKYDLFDLTVTEPIISYARNQIIQNYSKKNLDYRTEFPNAVIKRFLFNVIGTLNEVEYTNVNDTDYAKDKTNTKRMLESYEKFALHIPNLKSVLQEIGSKINVNDTDDNERNIFLNKLKNKYINFLLHIGEKSFKNILNDVYTAVLKFNNETKPSDYSKEIIERWLYMQTAALNQELINNFINKRRKYNIKWIYEEE